MWGYSSSLLKLFNVFLFNNNEKKMLQRLKTQTDRMWSVSTRQMSQSLAKCWEMLFEALTESQVGGLWLPVLKLIFEWLLGGWRWYEFQMHHLMQFLAVTAYFSVGIKDFKSYILWGSNSGREHLEKPVLPAARALNSFHDVCVSVNLFVYDVLLTAVLYMCIFL